MILNYLIICTQDYKTTNSDSTFFKTYDCDN